MEYFGKNSNFIFTEKTNTEVGLETNMIDDTICLSSKMNQESKLLAPQDYTEYHDVELAILKHNLVWRPQQFCNKVLTF